MISREGGLNDRGDVREPVRQAREDNSTRVGNSGAERMGGNRSVLRVRLEKALAEAKFEMGKSVKKSDERNGE